MTEAATTFTSVIDSSGKLLKPHKSSTSNEKGVVVLLTSPGTSILPSFPSVPSDAVSVSADSSDDVIMISSPGATLSASITEEEDEETTLNGGAGAAASGLLGGCIILSGVTIADVSSSTSPSCFADSRHGRTLTGLFLSRLKQQGEEEESGTKQLLVIAIQSGDDDEDKDVDVAGIKEQVEKLYDAAADAAVGGVATTKLEDLYEVEVAVVKSDDDAKKVMSMASAAATRSALPQGVNVASALAEAYSKVNTPSSQSSSIDTPSIAQAVLACDDAYARHVRAARAKLSAWKGRSSRGLIIDKFGSSASTLLKRTMDLYDRDTMAAAGLSSAAPYRLTMRSKLSGIVEKAIRDLFNSQIENLEKSTLKKFSSVLLRKMGKSDAGTQDFYNENASALRSAAFAFDTAATDLEVPSMSLTKTKAISSVSGKLNSALLSFPDSPAAKLKSMKEVQQMVSKQKKPTERSVDVGLDLVAMIRPDGFGSFQGFAGYQLGENSITVGVNNDADAPEVISQFGGVRPPFIRVQPKLKLDIEL
eukprot:CAMPEP_0185734984 /NCGR_PEP_ID=MMETSP1171-20130828/24061_1 /TAXON_ID=374046 /ORGANISM="Helicotheca tamensis, Strain CCMP826" /LENGTH=533 /DNA_ID=CAMNT_0028405141 /DNA_START=116 /DNA_END=1717 /DNA_ORIENTATION=+